MSDFHSILFIKSVISNTKKAPEDFLRAFLMNDFGRSDFSGMSLETIKKWESEVHTGLADTWRRCVAEELLRIETEGGSPPPDITSYFGNISPFGNDVSLSQALKRDWAMAVIPLDVPGEENGALAHLWLTRGLGLEMPGLEGIDDLPEGSDLVVRAHSNFGGCSWQLGAALALCALSNKDASAKRNLIRQWVVTGKLSGNWENGEAVLQEVEAGNKMSAMPTKPFLFPRQNADMTVSSRRTWYAGNLREAFNLVAGQGIVELGKMLPPKGCVELHSLVSERFYSILAAIVMFRPIKIVLWHSDDEEKSEKQARVVRDVFNELAIQGKWPQTLVELKKIHSKLAGEAEANLRKYFLERSEENEVLFNIGQGNHLMRFAVQLLAVEKQFTLIYKDFDNNAPASLTCLKLEKMGNWGTYSIDSDDITLNLSGVDRAMKERDFYKTNHKENDLKTAVLSILLDENTPMAIK